VLEALFAMGDPEAALSRMKRRYKGLVENGNTTLWERWPEWSEHPGTINHSWSGGPLTLLSEQVAGIRPLEPGWTCFAIRPQPGRLNEISASLLLPQGEIRFEARKIERRWKVRVSVPEGTVARPDFSALGLGDVPNKLSCGVWSFEIRIQKPVMEKESVYV
jgi:hypothetical protein